MEWITCENVYEETWRRLLEYANVEFAVESITRIHGEPSKKQKSNYIKQAKQARVSLLQAKEYFEAARNSSQITQPNHLYYGAASLATACMLLRGSGEYSLDILRKDKSNANHGLKFSYDSKGGEELLDNGIITVCENGHFANWYKTLQKEQRVLALNRIFSDFSAGVTRQDYIGKYSIVDFKELIDYKTDLSFLIKRLPDLDQDLARFGIETNTARGGHSVNFYKDKNLVEHIFTFHSSSTHQTLLKVISNFKCEKGVKFCFDIFNEGTSGVVKTRKDNDWPIVFPDSRDTLDHKTIYYSEPLSIPEVVDLYVLSYALSMLSRYYPDIWVSFLESHCKEAKLVERIIRILILKLPNLMLNQICGKNLIISNHRPIWH